MGGASAGQADRPCEVDRTTPGFGSTTKTGDTTMRLLSLIVTLALMLGLAPARAADAPAGCDSCAIKVDSLAEPTRLVGKWLFTREDSPANAAVAVDTSDTTKWRLVKAPGPWKHAYDDKKN